MKFWIVIFLLILVCFRGVCICADVNGWANLTYFSTETKIGDEEKSSWSFIQNYNLQVIKEFTPKVNIDANLGININETNDDKLTLLTPDIRLNLRNEYFDADTGYRISERGIDILTMISDEDRLTTESLNINFSTKSKKYPKLQFHYNKNINCDHLAVHDTDSVSTYSSVSTTYTYRFLNFNYEYSKNALDNYVTEFSTETDSHNGRVDFRKSFWKNKITTSASYSFVNTKRENKTGSQEVRWENKIEAIEGLYAQDSTPLTGPPLDNTYDALNDKDKTASAGINIGGSGNTDQNIGLHLIFPEAIELIYLYTLEPNFASSHTAFAWDVYSSTDNNTWDLIASNAIFEYNTDEDRFEISFPETNARYFKIVNTENDTNDLLVTEIEAYNYKTYAPFSTPETEQTTQNTQAYLRFRPTDWLSFTYDFTQDELKSRQDHRKSEKTRRQTNHMNCRVEKELNKYITTWAQYGRQIEYDSESEAEDKIVDTYMLHFLSSPLTNLDTDFSLIHTVSKEEGESQSEISSALLLISAKLREGADLDVEANIIHADNHESQSESTTKSINSDLRLELTRMLTAEIEYDTIWTTIRQTELDGDTTVLNSRAGVIFYWRPSHYFYLKGCYDINRDKSSGEKTTQQRYNMDMNWLITKKVQLDMGYTLDRNDTVSSKYYSNLSWNLSRLFTLRFSYDWSRHKEDMTEKTQTFITSLSASF